MLEHVGEDEVIELAFPKRQVRLKHVALDEHVELITSVPGRVWGGLDPRHVVGAGLLERSRQSALATPHVEDASTARRH